jgi:hypothetical protein
MYIFKKFKYLMPGLFLASLFPALKVVADPVLGSCQLSQVGLSLDGEYVYKIQQAPYSNAAEITVLSVKDGSIDKGWLDGLPISNTGTDTVFPAWDNRVGNHNLYFLTRNKTISFFSLSNLTVEAKYNFGNGSASGRSVYASSFGVENKTVPVRLKDWVLLPVLNPNAFQRALNWRTGETVRYWHKGANFYSVPIKNEFLNLMVGEETVCFTSGGSPEPECIPGELEEIYEGESELIARTSSGIFRIAISKGRVAQKKIADAPGGIFFDPNSLSITSESGQDLTYLVLNTNSKLLFRQKTKESNLQMIMIDTDADAALITKEGAGRAEVSLLQRHGGRILKQQICQQ